MHGSRLKHKAIIGLRSGCGCGSAPLRRLAVESACWSPTHTNPA